MPGSADWLAPDEDTVNLPATKRNPVLEALYDTTTPKQAHPMVEPHLDEPRRKLVRSLRRLMPHQRVFLRALMTCQCNAAKTVRLLRSKGMKYSMGTVGGWMRNPDYKYALNALKEHFLDLAGIDPAGLMIRAANIIDDAMDGDPLFYQGVEVTDRLGNPVKVRDRSAALKGIEFAAKVQKMIGGDEGKSRVMLNIVNMANKDDMVLEVSQAADE